MGLVVSTAARLDAAIADEEERTTAVAAIALVHLHSVLSLLGRYPVQQQSDAVEEMVAFLRSVPDGRSADDELGNSQQW